MKDIKLILALLSCIGTAALAQSDQNIESNDVTVLDEYVVTGTKTEKKLTDVPVRTELIKRTEIESYAALTLADVVDFTTGCRVENNCQNCNFSQLRLLGLDGAYSQILIDGQPMMSSLASVYGIEHIPARAIDRVEIVKGGGSALYGPGAVAGIVNVISRDPEESGAEIGLDLESRDGAMYRSFTGVGDVVSKDGKSKLTFLGQIDNQQEYDRDGDGYSELGERELKSLWMNYKRYIGESGVFGLDYSHTYEDRRGGNKLYLPEFMADIAESVQTTRHATSVSWSDAVSEDFDYRITGSLAFTNRDTYYGGGQDENAYGNSKNPVYILDTQFNNYFDAHTFTWGGQFQTENLKDSQPAYDRETDEDYSNVGFYAQDDWSISDEISLVLGGRVDKHSEIDDPIFSPRAALKWSPEDNFTVRTSYAHGFRAPQIFDEDLHIAVVNGEGQIITNDDDLKEESSDSFTLGMEYTPKAGPGYMLFEATPFYTMISDAFALDEADDAATADQEMLRVNRGGATVYGSEFNVGYKVIDSFEVQLGYVVQKSEYDDADDDFGSTDFFRTPDQYGVFKATWTIPETCDIFFGAKYTGPMSVPHYAGYIADDVLEETDSFLTFDVSVSKNWKLDNKDELTATVGVKNITDEYQEDLDQGADRDAGYVYGPRLPRTVFAKLQYAF